MRLHACELRVRVAVAGMCCHGRHVLPWQRGRVLERLSHGFSSIRWVFHVTLGLHHAVDVRDAAFCFLYNAVHFYGGGSFLTLPLALYRVNPLLGRQT
jgi:hypothetical protein